MESNCTFGEIILQQSSDPHRPTGVCLLTLESIEGPCVHSGGPSILTRSLSLSLQSASQRTGPRMGEKSPRLQPYPYLLLNLQNTPPNPTQPRKHLWIKWPLPVG